MSHHDVRAVEQCMRDLGLREAFVVYNGTELHVPRPGVTVAWPLSSSPALARRAGALRCFPDA